MLGTRYEEYLNFNNELPFILSTDIYRTPAICSLEANWHENLEIELCTEGQGFVLLDGVKINIGINDIIVVNSHVIHYTGTSDKLKYTCLIIDSQFCREADIDPFLLCFNSHFKSKTFEMRIKELQTIYENKNDVCRIAKLREVTLKILIELREKHTVEKNVLPARKDSIRIVKHAIKFIRENYSRKLSLDEVSKSVFTDKYNLSREFKIITGQTIFQYLNHYRCKQAAGLIADGKNIADAALICGFNNMSFFTRIFKRYMDDLPSKYKNNTHVLKRSFIENRKL